MMLRTIKPYGTSGQYLEFKPTTMTPKGIILFLHGLGEVGTDITIIEKLPIPSLFKSGLEVPYIVICPQLQSGTGWSKNVLLSLYDVMLSYKMTENHVTGLSLGAIGTTALLSHVYLATGKVANVKTAGICCGKTSATDMAPYLTTNLRWWHGINDTTLPISNARGFMKRYADAGGTGQLIEYPNMGHSIWNTVYNPNTAEGYWKWLESLEVPSAPVDIKVPVTTMEIVNGQYLLLNGTHKVDLTTI